MGVRVRLCAGCWRVQTLHGTQGTASVSGGVRSGQLTPLHGQVTAKRDISVRYFNNGNSSDKLEDSVQLCQSGRKAQKSSLLLK